MFLMYLAALCVMVLQLLSSGCLERERTSYTRVDEREENSNKMIYTKYRGSLELEGIRI